MKTLKKLWESFDTFVFMCFVMVISFSALAINAEMKMQDRQNQKAQCKALVEQMFPVDYSQKDLTVQIQKQIDRKYITCGY